MYALEVRAHVDEAFKKLSKKDPKQFRAMTKKIGAILKNPHRFKPLRCPLAGARRVHFGNYVLLYTIDEARKTVVLEDYAHHDEIYR
jgi:YafQ family addiction module toxin component